MTQPRYHLPVLDKGFVQLADPSQDVLGSDLKTVNAARTSFASASEQLDVRDTKLITYLATHNHTSPFRHSALSFRVKMPLFVAAQWRTHMVASALQAELHSYNEISGRYVELTEEFYEPNSWRGQHPTSKQASAGPLDASIQESCNWDYTSAVNNAYAKYQNLLARGVARELARIVLPQCLYTQFMWTASLQAIANFILLRDDTHAQWEIQEYARAVRQIAEDLFPHSLSALLAPRPPSEAQLELVGSAHLRKILEERGYVVVPPDASEAA